MESLENIINNPLMVKCKYCFYEYPSHQQFVVFSVIDWNKKTRKPEMVCPNCQCLNTMEIINKNKK